MCGTKAIVDKRILDPPLVVQMVFDDPAQEKLYFSNTNFLVCHVTLYSSNGEQVAAFIQHEKTGSKVVQKVLLGDDPVTARILNDPEDNKPHLFFVLSSLSIRYTGFYSLRCTVIDIQG
ncbi:velvet factor [Globomyces pollinis-pini]|nr:velvet factor [Globomyces pollinis-pini]